MDTHIDTGAPVETNRPGRGSRLPWPPWPRGLPPPAVIGAVVLAALVIVMLALAGLRLSRPGALPGTVVPGMEVGGLREGELRAAISKLAQQRTAINITVIQGAKRATARAADLGYRVDVDRTVAAVLSRGRQANPLASLTDHLRAVGGRIPVELVQTVDNQKLDSWAAETARTLGQEPIEGSLRFEGATVLRVDPQPGARVLPHPLREAARAALLGSQSTTEAGEVPRWVTITAQTEPVKPRTSRRDVDAVYVQATRAVSAPVRLYRQDKGKNAARTFSPVEISKMLQVTPGKQGEPALKLTADRAAVERVFTPQQRALFEIRAVDARIALAGGTVVISESSPGFRIDLDAAAGQILTLATSDGRREAEVAGQVVQPTLTTEQARGLGIIHQVSSFTTNHACCQSRVTNIHRIADMVNGVMIRPGKTFSLNAHVGNRIPEKGFVPGKAIQGGEFVDQIGGGVSQFTTTMFNAAYFGGYDIVQHKPHSYYISRYPEGREATLNYPSVDLKIRNNSPHGVLVQTSYTDTSVTVSFWATKWVTVESITGPRTDLRDPQTRYRENPSLPPGDEQVVQEGSPGFNVTVTRILRFPDGRERRQEFRTRYEAVPTIIERNSGS